ncbi:MAG: hypothetical protein ACUBOA_07105 [Candidatus Loosdrechtia sp.]|uniref:hypothetical protein n=1 Tax=Candidatus Loosdrechtia sp. TaxID=3101272 RepID=UPI003A6C73C8|nr:MAG: hypothetical protein QY305_01250 [Candidatus Jettenia sp. AMX2]
MIFMEILVTLFVIGINVIIAIYLYGILKRIPGQYRTVEPYFVLLALIPFIGLVFSWIVVPFKLPSSLRNYFVHEKSGELNMSSDFGKRHGLGLVMANTLGFIPGINLVAWILGFVFLVLYLIQMRKLSRMLPKEII